MLIPTLASLSESTRWLDPSVLERLDRVRKAWEEASRRIVQAVLASHVRDLTGGVIEIGAGGGQLRAWLPAEIAARTIHTEPSEPFLHFLKTHHPGAAVAKADATKLPFADRSVAAILGLCVLDAVADLDAVRDECHRVLKPGGVIVHFLDLGTNPDACFSELLRQGEVPLPNFTQEPGLIEELSAAVRERLPTTDPFDEVLAVAWEPFVKLLATLQSARHPLVAKLTPYTSWTLNGNLDPFSMGQEFMRVRSEPQRLRERNHALLSLVLLAGELGRPLPLRAVSLRSHLRSRLESSFSPAVGFTIECAGPVAVRESSTDGRYMLRHAGRTLFSPRPIELPGILIDDVTTNSKSLNSDRPFRATTIEVFAARKGWRKGDLSGEQKKDTYHRVTESTEFRVRERRDSEKGSVSVLAAFDSVILVGRTTLFLSFSF